MLPYTVAANGQIDVAAGSTLRGGILQNGRFAVLAGGLVNLENPVLWLFLK
jgi:hypothetical protein